MWFGAFSISYLYEQKLTIDCDRCFIILLTLYLVLMWFRHEQAMMFQHEVIW